MTQRRSGTRVADRPNPVGEQSKMTAVKQSLAHSRNGNVERHGSDSSVVQQRLAKVNAGRPLGLLVIACWGAVLALGSATANTQNLLMDLGPITGFGSGRALNNSGVVVLGTESYSNDTFTPFPAGFSGTAINAQGDVAGVNAAGNAALDIGGTVTDLGNLNGNQIQSVAAINASKQLVGAGLQVGGVCCVGFIYSGGAISPINFPQRPGATGSEASDINDIGQVTGCTIAPSNTPVQEAFIFASGTFTDLGGGCANAINASGQVTGYLLAADLVTRHAFIYANGTMTVLTEPPPANNSQAVAINSGGQMVGLLSDHQTALGAFFYNGVMTNVNLLISAADPLKSSVSITQALAINDNRLMLLQGGASAGTATLYLLQAPWLDVAPGPLTFPGLQPGTTSAAQLVTLTNSGAAPLPLDSIASQASEFPQTNACPNPLPPSANCMVSVKFAPTAAGSYTSNLDVVTAGATIAVPLAGTGIIKITISASAAAVTTGTAVKLTWTVSPGATCTATGGSAADGWTGTVALSGTQSVTESTAGTYAYGLLCTAGSLSQSKQTTVNVTGPTLSVSLTASPTTITSGNSTTLTWSSANAKTCLASGGGTDDGWAGTMRATAGSAAITEPVVVASPLPITFTLTCSNSGTGQSTPASVKVVLNPPAKSGGGGALDLFSIIALLSTLTLRAAKDAGRAAPPN
jgi:probable HAF family extracellular repeat protein